MKSGKQEFNRKMKRAMIFIACYFVVALLISSLLIIYTDIPQWLNGMVIVISAAVFYLIFLFVCAKIDKKKEERTKDSLKKNDPFGD